MRDFFRTGIIYGRKIPDVGIFMQRIWFFLCLQTRSTNPDTCVKLCY